MYVDESGVENKADQTKYFVVSGAVFHENALPDMKKHVQSFYDDTFTGKFKGNVIHVHDIFKGQKSFAGITRQEADDMLSSVYTLINELEFDTISVAIDKPALTASKFSNYDVLETAYKFLIERFNNFLRRTENKGLIRIDKTSNKAHVLNKKDCMILSYINHIRHHGTNWQSVRNIVEEPLFYDSFVRKGLQIADAVAYCTDRYLNKNNDSDS